MNIEVHVSFCIIVFPRYMPTNRIEKSSGNSICIFFLIFIYLFIYLVLAVLGLCFSARAFSSCGEWGPLFIAVSGPLTVAASLVAEHRLQRRRLSSCGSRTQLLRGMWDLPRPGLEPVSPALAGRLPTTAPPGKPYLYFFKEHPYCSPQQLYRFTFPPTVQEGSFFYTPSPAFIICRHFDDGHSDQHEIQKTKTTSSIFSNHNGIKLAKEKLENSQV